MKMILGAEEARRRTRALTAAAVATGVMVFGVATVSGESVDRPPPPGSDLGNRLDALRGANDLVRATRTEVGRDPALYPTAYGRQEAALVPGRGAVAAVPPVRTDALADLARHDALDTPAWRAHYVCLSVGTDAGTVLERADLREEAEREALAYVRAPDAADDALTSLATRAAFLQTLTCLGRDDEVPRTALEHFAADVAEVGEPLPALYAVEASRAAGVPARATRVLRDAGSRLEADCGSLEPLQRAALTLLHGRLTSQSRACLLPALRDADTQTRWVVRRALMTGGAGSLPAPPERVRPDGLVAKSPSPMGTLSATYQAARAVAAAGGHRSLPGWLTARLKAMGSDPGLDPTDRFLLAMTCHRVVLQCGPQADKGVKEAAAMKVPARLTPSNQRSWTGAMAARAEFGLGCPRTSVERPRQNRDDPTRLPRIVVALANAGCTAQAERLGSGSDFAAQGRAALRAGDLTAAADLIQAALAVGETVPRALWDEIPRLLERFRDPEHPDLYAPTPGGAASVDATRSAYYLLA
ncbi:hypothetical protein [Streptomyces sp. NPDC060194]|uniref:hypothetical protein n=1 Tax=Streptomyces sp. NPDC060194 TaxID=3347069 RepID=UPI00364BD407